MCDDVIIHYWNNTEKRCSTQGELQDAMKNGLVFPAGGKFDAPVCLCPVDLEATANQNGFRYSRDDPDGEFDPFDKHFYMRVVL